MTSEGFREYAAVLHEAENAVQSLASSLSRQTKSRDSTETARRARL